MNKMTAADELQRLATLFGSLTEVAAQLRTAGSMEQALAEAKKLREAEMLDLEKTKAQVKRAKEDLKKQEELLDQCSANWKEAEALMQENHAKLRQEHKTELAKMTAAAMEELAQIDADTKRRKDVQAAIIEQELAPVRAQAVELDEVIKAKSAELEALDAKLEKAKKALAKLGMKFDD